MRIGELHCYVRIVGNQSKGALQQTQQPRCAIVPASGVYESAKDEAIEVEVSVGVL